MTSNRSYDLAFYGDDFTGSTDALDVLERAGIPTILLLGEPSQGILDRFPEARAVGLAGMSRSRSPEWMDRELPPVFAALRDLGAPFVHYKVCSTFDSAPGIGSIGRAIDRAADVFQNRWTPLVVGAPALRRYTVFGNHFATVAATTHRIDRHPTMSRHPVTPMDEGDLRRHLARQTGKRIGLVDVLALSEGEGAARLATEIADGAEIVLFDVLDSASLAEIGRLIATEGDGVQFIAGSSGVEYALTAYWRSIGRLPPAPVLPGCGAVEKLLVVSGSCSPVTAAQIAAARAAGFETIPLDARALLDPRSAVAIQDRAAAAMFAAFKRGHSVVVHSAEGPDADMIEGFRALAAGRGIGSDESSASIGLALGTIARRAREQAGIARLAIAGGDTSGAVAQAMGLTALTMAASSVPGAPICRAAADTAALDGLEVVFKGGQIGGPDYFIGLRDGAA